MSRSSVDQTAVAIVTGGAQRIGAAIVHALHESGMNIVIHYRSSGHHAHSLKRELDNLRPNSVMLSQGDLCDHQIIENLTSQTIKHFGRLDLLVNNASNFYTTPIKTASTDDFDDLMGINLKAPLFLSKSAAPFLKQTNGAIINITDIYAERPLKDYAIYCAAKAALASLTRSLARELAPNIRVNAIAPGAILWPEDDSVRLQQQNQIISRTPLASIGKVQDIQNAVLYLTNSANFVTGQILRIDGGRSVTP